MREKERMRRGRAQDSDLQVLKFAKVSQIVCLPIFQAVATQIALVAPLQRDIVAFSMRRFELVEFADPITDSRTANRYSLCTTWFVIACYE